MEYVIRHTAFRAVTALTLAMDPAYPTTTVGLREAFMEDNKEGIRERLETIKPTIIPSGRFRREVEINNINNMYNH
jgi:hypothetical protein